MNKSVKKNPKKRKVMRAVDAVLMCRKKMGSWVWCLHCHRCYRVGEYRLEKGLQMCPYEGCDGDTIADAFQWDEFKEGGEAPFPEVPERGVMYPAKAGQGRDGRRGDVEVAAMDENALAGFSMEYHRGDASGQISARIFSLNGVGWAVWRLDEYLSKMWVESPEDAEDELESLGRNASGCQNVCVVTDRGVLVGIFGYEGAKREFRGLAVLDAESGEQRWGQVEDW